MRTEFIQARRDSGISPSELAYRVGVTIRELAGFFFKGEDLPEEVVSELREELNIVEESEVQ